MSKITKVLLLVGSPRGEESTSVSLGNYLLSKLKYKHIEIKRAFIHRLVNRESKIKELLSMVEEADLIILAFPLYVDSLPAPVIRAMELIKQDRISSNTNKNQKFVAISNCGFPEASQIKVANEICENFSRDVKFDWKGGIAVGGGGLIHGTPLEERGGPVKKLMKGLDIAALALSENKSIPQEAIELASKNLIPIKLYKSIGNVGWRIQARRYGARKKLRARPYSPCP